MESNHVLRFDLASGTISNVRRTPQGGLVLNARLTRVGVFIYQKGDGKIVRELRPPEEVFDPESLATLAHAPLTDDHPGAVTPANFKDVTIGHVAGTPKQDGDYVDSEIRVQDGDAVADVEDGKLVEASCGYTCRLDWTPGVWNGQKYDCIQRKIRYNHVALGPAGWGRAGSEVRLRMDADGVLVSDESAAPEPSTTAPPSPSETPTKSAKNDAAKAPSESMDRAPYLRRMDEKEFQARLDAAEKRIAELSASLTSATAESEVLKLQIARSEKTQRQDAKDAAFFATVEELVATREDARRILGEEWKADGKRAEVIRREILKELEPDFNQDGKTDDAIAAAYTLAVRHADSASSSRGELQELTFPRHDKKGKPSGRDDEDEMPEDEDTVDAAAKRMADRNRDAWKSGSRADVAKKGAK